MRDDGLQVVHHELRRVITNRVTAGTVSDPEFYESGADGEDEVVVHLPPPFRSFTT